LFIQSSIKHNHVIIILVFHRHDSTLLLRRLFKYFLNFFIIPILRQFHGGRFLSVVVAAAGCIWMVIY
jgi:hypothetical protein